MGHGDWGDHGVGGPNTERLRGSQHSEVWGSQHSEGGLGATEQQHGGPWGSKATVLGGLRCHRAGALGAMGQPLHPPVSLPAPLSPSPPGTDPRPHSLTHSFISPPRLSPRPLPVIGSAACTSCAPRPLRAARIPDARGAAAQARNLPARGLPPDQGLPRYRLPSPAPPAPAMAARGRGRGQMTFNVEAVGIGKGDALPPPHAPALPPVPGTAILIPKSKQRVVLDKEEAIKKLEETDYIMSYFDNGEDFGGDSDDNMDEAVY
ncbi:hypothetical protein Q9233_012650 [Columba guinea]|nr:hypothetical protein Q9233_012650 [Columba guinea]